MADTSTAHIQAYHRGVLSTQLAAITGSSSLHSLVVTGHSSSDDGACGVAHWDASDSTTLDNGATVWGAGVGRWKRNYSGSINVRWFGAKGDGVTDDIVALQAAVDYAIANNLGEVFVPAGLYSISRTWHVYKSLDYSGVVIRGEGYKYASASGYGFCGTAIVTTHSNASAINIQGARGTVLRDISLLGGLATFIATGKLGQTAQQVVGDTAAAAWDSGSLSATAESRYAPFAGVSIDGWSGTSPATHYPTTYLAYGQNKSSDVLLENVFIQGFNTAVVVQPCDADANGDFTVIRRATIYQCKWGVSIGNTQSRNVDLDNVKFAAVFCALTNKQHGRQTGRFAGVIKNMSCGDTIRLFDFGPLSVCGPILFQQLYAEGLWRIGDIAAAGTTESSVLFEGGILAFHGQDDYRGIPGTVLNVGSTVVNVEFKGTTFGSYRSVLPFNVNGIRFDGSLFASSTRQSGLGAASYLAPFHNATCDGVIMRRVRTDEDHRIKFTQLNAATGAVSGTVMVHARMKETDRTTGIPAWAVSCASLNDNSRDRIDIPQRNNVVAKSSLTVTPIQDAAKPFELTLVFGALSDTDAELNGMLPGDCFVDDQTHTTFVIRSRVTTTVVAEAQNNYKLSAGAASAYTTVDAFSTTVGNFYFLNCRIYTPARPVIADLTSGSAVLATAARDDGTSFVATDIAVNDHVLITDFRDNWVSTTNTNVDALDSTAKTITLHGNVSRTVARKRIPFFIRQPPANAASR